MTVGEYTARIGGFTRTVPLVPISADFSIAYLDFLCDRPLVRAAANGLAERLSPLGIECLVGPATGAIPLCFMTADLLDIPHVVLRKETRGYMGEAVRVPVRSAAAAESECLLVEGRYLDLLRSSRIALLDTVVTTGNTFRAMESLMIRAGATVAARAAALIEGDTVDPEDFVHLGQLPLFLNSPAS
jgi:adenine/guanine phosphoribosyltransferase-like PRPP-binding protein